MKKQKIYELIGKMVVYLTLHASAVAFTVWAFTRTVIYR